MDQKLKILVLEGRPKIALHSIYCLLEQKNYEVHLLSRFPKSMNKFSRLIASYRFCDGDDKAFIEAIDEQIDKFQCDLLMPLFELDIELVLNNFDHFREKINIIPLPSAELYQMADHKGMLAEFLQDNNINTPETIVYYNKETFLEQAKSMSYPALLKATQSYGGSGISKVEKYDQLEPLLDQQSQLNRGSLILQEMIDGYDVDCNILCVNGETKAISVQKGLFAPKAYAMAEIIEIKHNQEIVKLIQKLFQKMKWSGLAHVDLRFDRKTQNFKIIEINPRFWGTILGSLVAGGINFPVLTVKASFQQEIKNHQSDDGYFVFFERYFKDKLKRGKDRQSRKLQLSDTDFKWFIRDPLPRIMGHVYFQMDNIKKKIGGKRLNQKPAVSKLTVKRSTKQKDQAVEIG